MTAPLRELFGGGGMWCALGTVTTHDGDDAHWEVNDDGQLMVAVALHNQGTPVWPLVSGLISWEVPDVGDEVLVGFDGGELEGEAVLVAVLRSAPEGVQPGRHLVVSDDIRLVGHDASENAVLGQQLKSLILAVLDALIIHTHPAVGGSTGPMANAATLTAEKAKVTAEQILSQFVWAK